MELHHHLLPPVSGYIVYRNGEVINQVIGYENTSYSEFAFGNGPEEYSYYVTAMYEDWNIESASTDTVQILLLIVTDRISWKQVSMEIRLNLAGGFV